MKKLATFHYVCSIIGFISGVILLTAGIICTIAFSAMPGVFLILLGSLAISVLIFLLSALMFNISKALNEDAKRLDYAYANVKSSNNNKTPVKYNVVEAKDKVPTSVTRKEEIISQSNESATIEEEQKEDLSIEEYLEKYDYEFYSAIKIYHADDEKELNKALLERYNKLTGK